MKKIISLILALTVLLSLGALADNETLNVAALNGPTGMGMVKLMSDEEGKDAYAFTLAGSADVIVPGFIKGEYDIVCVPANLASVLYNRTNGGVRVLAINTLGVLYIVERDDTVHSFADLKGRTIYSAGMGATPEYALRYLLKQNGLDAEKDVNIVWQSEHAECLTALINDPKACAMLPQPFVTVAQSKKDDVRIALDLTEEWNKVTSDSAMLTGVVIARAAFADENPDAVAAFMEAYAASVQYVNENVEEAAKLIGGYEIVAEQVAVKALPYCNIVCIGGEEMKTLLSGYLNVLFEQDASSVGGALPNEEFYYIP
ncbi:MAG: ABC transporter substrate-binding protein [Clostridia bacterium]|nr:ABC transporter substrate-binding protein [Clostridia bacterium]